MTSRERMLCAINNGRPDRLPCQVHGWMDYYLKTYLNGMDWFEAYEKFDMDFALYISPEYIYDPNDLNNWQVIRKEDKDKRSWETQIVTPEGVLNETGAWNDFTAWNITEIIKSEADFELWNKYYPVPIATDFTKINEAKKKIGDRGIIRSHPFSPGQGSPWQSFCTMYGTEPAIMLAMDNPDYLHYALDSILEKTLSATKLWDGIPSDMVETGGGAGSNTVISPSMFKEFCVPYDQKQCAAFHDVGLKVVYHLCGGLMKMLDLVVENGADGLETMTPASMGGDCDLKEASCLVGDKLFFMGGFDQNAGFERGTPEMARKLVYECFEATKDHAGYICVPSDHFFFGNPENLQAFSDACKECVY